MNNATGRTGQVFLEHFDVGLATTIGAQLIDVSLDGEIAKEYAILFDSIVGPDQYNGMVPVVFSNPEDVYQSYLLPSVYLNRSSIAPDMQRWFGGGREYMVPAAVATYTTIDGVQVPNRVETKSWTLPYTINYEVHCRARLRRQADLMLQQLGKHLWAYGQLFLTDSIGEERGYYAFVDSIDTLDEIADVADRTMGHMISIRVEAELDFNEPSILPTQTNLVTNVGVK